MEEWEVFTVKHNLGDEEEKRLKDSFQKLEIEFLRIKYIPLKSYIVRGTPEQMEKLENTCDLVKRKALLHSDILLKEER